jgi:hypothetical protein
MEAPWSKYYYSLPAGCAVAVLFHDSPIFFIDLRDFQRNFPGTGMRKNETSVNPEWKWAGVL